MKAARFKVVYEMEISASTPEIAAMVVRDMMLDPTQSCHVDVFPTEYVEGPDDWFPVSERGWQVRFDGDSPVDRTDCIAWEVYAHG